MMCQREHRIMWCVKENTEVCNVSKRTQNYAVCQIECNMRSGQQKYSLTVKLVFEKWNLYLSKLNQKLDFNLVNDCCEGEICTMYSIPIHLTFVHKVMSVNKLCVTSNSYFVKLLI